MGLMHLMWGADDKGRLVGARCIKYYPDKDGTGGWANNDFVVFRYGDVLMMKAEALIRQGKDLSTAIDLVNQIRDARFRIIKSNFSKKVHLIWILCMMKEDVNLFGKCIEGLI